VLKVFLVCFCLGFVSTSFATTKIPSRDQPEAISGSDFRIDSTNIPVGCACNHTSDVGIGEDTNPTSVTALAPKATPTAK
jgi:hypothetical protein